MNRTRILTGAGFKSSRYHGNAWPPDHLQEFLRGDPGRISIRGESDALLIISACPCSSPIVAQYSLYRMARTAMTATTCADQSQRARRLSLHGARSRKGFVGQAPHKPRSRSSEPTPSPDQASPRASVPHRAVPRRRRLHVPRRRLVAPSRSGMLLSLLEFRTQVAITFSLPLTTLATALCSTEL